MEQPLGSVKALRNIPTNILTSNLDVFLSKNNLVKLSNDLYLTYLNNGGKMTVSQFDSLIVFLIRDFIKGKDLNEYSTVESNATGYSNHIEVLNFINNDFKKFFYNYMRWNVYNPFKADVKLTNETKKGYELSAQDHGEINIWQNESTTLNNSRFRNNNKIPFYEAALYNRHYDRESDGLNAQDMSGLESPIDSYNMNDIYGNIDNYRKEENYKM